MCALSRSFLEWTLYVDGLDPVVEGNVEVLQLFSV